MAVIATVGAIAATGITVGVGLQPASAALGTTQFEIDGDTVVGAGQDWASDPGVATNLRAAPWETQEPCDEAGVDPSQIVPGNKLDDIDISQPPVQAGNVNIKADLCSVYRAWELIFVPDPGNPDPDAGQYQFIFYGGWSRPNVNGEIDVLFPLLGDDPASQTDDIVIFYDFNDSDDETFVRILLWDTATSAWLPTELDPAVFEAVTTRGVETHATSGDELTFGEFAINLTLAEVSPGNPILPESGPCVSFASGDPMTRTGNSDDATLKDIVDATPVQLTNCGSITVTKTTVPASPAVSTNFGIHIEQSDGETVLGDGSTSIDDELTVPEAPSTTFSDIIISPDYVVTETALPAGWSEESLICTSFDPIAGVEVTRTLYSDDAAGPDVSFPVAPGVEATCEVVNVGPPTVTVQKTTIGGVGGPFGFTIVDTDGAHSVAATTTTPDTPTTVSEGPVVVAPGSVTVAETAVPAGFFEGSLSCAVTSVDGSVTTVGGTFDLAPGDSAVCVQENIAAASLSVTKVVDPPDSTGWSFDFTISPVPAGETATKTATSAAPTVSWTGLEPGDEYTVAETPEAGYITGDLLCGESGETGTSTFTPAAGEDVECTALNTELASAAVTKTVDGTATGWSFDFTISPVPAGETATKTATSAAPTVGWAGLVPGTDYTITETPEAGYITGVLLCGESGSTGSSTFSPDAGESVACSITNTELADVAVTKTVNPAANGWSFDFTISPVPAGETATKTATSAAPTVGWAGLVPGTDYTITETPEAGYITGVLLCGESGTTGSSTFSPDAGESVACSITNTELADVAVTKTVNPAANGWSFDFTISPVPAGETATKIATSAAPTVGWTGLVPGTAYTVTEVDDTDLVIGTMVCTGGTTGVGTSTFTPQPGQSVGCSITNTRITDIEVVKSTTGDSVLVGGVKTWTISVANNGPSTAFDVVLTDPLPAGLSLTAIAAPASWNCSASTFGAPGRVSCTKPDMIAGEIWSFTLTTTVVSAVPGSTITNVAVVATTTDETTTANNTDAASTVVEAVAILPPTGGYVHERLLAATTLLALGGALVLLTRPGRRRRV